MAKLLVAKWQIEDKVLGLNYGVYQLGAAIDRGEFIEFEISGKDPLPDYQYITARIKRTEELEFCKAMSPDALTASTRGEKLR